MKEDNNSLKEVLYNHLTEKLNPVVHIRKTKRVELSMLMATNVFQAGDKTQQLVGYVDVLNEMLNSAVEANPEIAENDNKHIDALIPIPSGFILSVTSLMMDHLMKTNPELTTEAGARGLDSTLNHTLISMLIDISAMMAEKAETSLKLISNMLIGLEDDAVLVEIRTEIEKLRDFNRKCAEKSSAMNKELEELK